MSSTKEDYYKAAHKAFDDMFARLIESANITAEKVELMVHNNRRITLKRLEEKGLCDCGVCKDIQEQLDKLSN